MKKITPMANKSPEMRKALEDFFPGLSDDLEAQVCPTCKKRIDMADFDGRLSLKEYHISGMCQTCQDIVFNER